MITVNCYIGERGADHPVDIELMKVIGAANVACGGHAGDEASVKAFLKMAKARGVKVTAHLSYPDKENFGRKSLAMPAEKLAKALDAQYALMPEVKTVKFHGALYNDANVNVALARFLVDWMKEKGVRKVVTLSDSELASEAKKAGLKVVAEAYAERNYAYDPGKKQLTLSSRAKDYGSITDCDAAIKHATRIINEGQVSAYVDDTIRIDVPIKVETICIHSDSKIALDLAKRLAEALKS
jgi:UPF0271 protein